MGDRSNAGVSRGGTARRALEPVERLESRRLLSVGGDAVDLWLSRDADGVRDIAAAASPAGASPLSALPILHSLAGAHAKLFLDFDGDVTADWGGQHPGTTPAYDVDGDPTTFSTVELANINEIWSRVTEVYSPFNLDVTTQDPGNLNDLETSKVVVGGDGAWRGVVEGGVGIIDSFSRPQDPNVAFAFAKNLYQDARHAKDVAEVIAHEAGHGFGLHHQSLYDATGALVNAYNPGDDLRAPIMGANRQSQRVLWWNGPNDVSSTTMQDDMAVIAGATNGFGYRLDVQGATPALSGDMTVSGTARTESGVIEKTSDVDYFRFTAGAGPLSFTVNPAQYGGMLDVKLELRNAADQVVASQDAVRFGGETLTANVAAGTYYLVVKSHGDHGDVGLYSIGGTVAATTLGDLVVHRLASWPDRLTISDVPGAHVEPSVFFGPGKLYLDFHVSNNGNGTVQQTFLTRVLLDGVLVQEYFTSPPVPSFTGFQINDLAVDVTPGTHTFTVLVDPTNLAPEVDDNNNSYSRTIQVTAKLPDLRPYRAAGWPDTVVISAGAGDAVEPAVFQSGKTFYVDWAVSNVGPGTTAVAFTNRLLVDGVQVASYTVNPPLAPDFGNFYYDTAIGPLTAGQHTVSVEGDYGHTIGEANEDDNAYTRTITVVPADSTPPTVRAGEFRYDRAPLTVVLTFSEDVGPTVQAGDLSIAGPGGATYLPTDLTYDSTMRVAAFVIPLLPDGNYRASLAAGSVADAVGNALAAKYDFDFFVLAGDANHDRAVNFGDLLTLARNYNKAGMTYAQGDFDYNGTINFNDLLILARNYNKTLAAPAPAVVPAAAAPARDVLTRSSRGTDEKRKPVFSLGPVVVVKPVPLKAKARPVSRGR